jgi:hypothetical protein
MLSRIIVALALATSVMIAPAAPIDIAKAFSPQMKCCARTQVSVDPCKCCPISSNQTTSTSGLTCCSAQAPCFVFYANSSDDFLADVSKVQFACFANDSISTRFQRPPVPPPRIALS